MCCSKGARDGCRRVGAADRARRTHGASPCACESRGGLRGNMWCALLPRGPRATRERGTEADTALEGDGARQRGNTWDERPGLLRERRSCLVGYTQRVSAWPSGTPATCSTAAARSAPIRLPEDFWSVSGPAPRSEHQLFTSADDMLCCAHAS